MANYEQLPGELNIKTTISDDVSILFDFDIDLTGYTFSSVLIPQGTETPTTLTITATDLANGKITLSVTNTTLATIGRGVHRWWLKWITPTPGLLDRKVLYGLFELVA